MSSALLGSEDYMSETALVGEEHLPDQEMDVPKNTDEALLHDSAEEDDQDMQMEAAVDSTDKPNVSTFHDKGFKIKNHQNSPSINPSEANKSEKQQIKREDLKYCSTDNGPFSVYIEKTCTDNKESLNAIKVGGVILSELPELDNKIKNIAPIGRNRIKIIFSHYQDANTLVSSNKLKKYGIIAYIPGFILHSKGVIRGVYKAYSEDYLKKIIKPFDRNLSNSQVTEVKRINRKVNKDDTSSNAEYTPTQSIIVTFKSQILPKFVVVNKVRCEVEPYIQRVLLCYNC